MVVVVVVVVVVVEMVVMGFSVVVVVVVAVVVVVVLFVCCFVFIFIFVFQFTCKNPPYKNDQKCRLMPLSKSCVTVLVQRGQSCRTRHTRYAILTARLVTPVVFPNERSQIWSMHNFRVSSEKTDFINGSTTFILW